MQDHTNREREVFEGAVALCSAEERTAFLEQACAGDADLRVRIEELLEACDLAGGFLADDSEDESEGNGRESGEQAGNRSVAGERAGDLIGRYRLLERIGEGGFGVVYLAEQQVPVKRRVALKILKLGMDTRQVIARFELERQALALMDHPCIARVFDAGTTERGRPFFVMELVDGIPITRFCDEHGLSLEERMKLFAEVCGAVQHAHQKGVIHRDLKPSNILVAMQEDGRPLPKVIDFGIAKAATPSVEERSALTWAHQILGTPAYMSPEQADGGGIDVDTRSDVYSLGILLYELLTGHTPFETQDLMRLGFDAVQRMIREEDAPLPSVRVNRLDAEVARESARVRGLDRDRHARRLRGDLDWIVSRALRKDRAERYESAVDLARDIARHLANEPVVAAAPTFGYRLGKFIRRHRAGLLVSGGIFLLLVIGAGISAYFAVWALRSNRELQGEEAVTRALNRFLTEDFLSQVDPDTQPDRDIRLRTVLDRASAQVGERFGDQPLIEAAIRFTLGRAYENLGEYEMADPHYRRACEIRFHELGEGHRQTLEAMSALALVHSLRDDDETAVALGERVLALADERLGRRDPFTVVALCRLAQITFAARDDARAREFAREAMTLFESVQGVPVHDQVAVLHVLARTVARQGLVEEGEGHLRDAVDLARKELGPAHPRTLAAMSWLGAYLYDHKGSPLETEGLYLEALELARRTLGEGHIRCRILRGNLAILYRYGFEDRMEDALHHQLEMVRHGPRPVPRGDLARLREFLAGAPPSVLRPVTSVVPHGWLAARFRPSAGWLDVGFADASWTRLVDSPGLLPRAPAGGEVWLRQTFELENVGDAEWIVTVQSDGRWAVSVNAVPLPRVDSDDPAERLTVYFFDEAARAALRRGRNVVTLHGEGVPEGEFVDFRLLESPRPRPRPAQPENGNGAQPDNLLQ